MAKNFLSSLILCAFSLGFAYNVDANEAKNLKKSPQLVDVCNAPPPDSFRVTSIGSDFISLAWHPAWTGATHRLIVSRKLGNNTWIPIDTVNNTPEATITLSGLDLSFAHHVSIATNCSENDPSVFEAVIDDINLIIDLALDGRIPIQPVQVPCDKIPLSSPWKGFRIIFNSQGLSAANLFECVEVEQGASNNSSGTRFAIRRVGRYNPIVAVDQIGNWPKDINPLIPDVFKPFGLRRLLTGSNFEQIGHVEVSSNGSIISLCASPNYPWDSDYMMIPMVAESVYEQLQDPILQDRFNLNFTPDKKIRVQNPFNEYLNVFLPTNYSESGKITFRLLDFKGKTVMVQKVEIDTPHISFPVEYLPSGVYSLAIETEGNVQNFKVIKSE